MTKKKRTIWIIILSVIVMFAISITGTVMRGENFLKDLAIFGAIFLPSIFFVGLLIRIIIALKGDKPADRKKN